MITENTQALEVQIQHALQSTMVFAFANKLSAWEAFDEAKPFDKIYCFTTENKEDTTALNLTKFGTNGFVVEYAEDLESELSLNSEIFIKNDHPAYDYVLALYEWAEKNAKPVPNRNERIADYIEELEARNK